MRDADGDARRRGTRPARDMPAGAEAIRAERRQARQARALAHGETAGPTSGEPVPVEGSGPLIVRSALVGTAVFAAVSVLAAIVPALRIAAVIVDLVLLLAGCLVYLWGWGVAAGRSRDSAIRMWNLILLEDVAPTPIRAWLLGALGVQVAVAAATCWVASPLAFGWLVPVWGLAHCELWGARHGEFPARKPEAGRRGQR